MNYNKKDTRITFKHQTKNKSILCIDVVRFTSSITGSAMASGSLFDNVIQNHHICK